MAIYTRLDPITLLSLILLNVYFFNKKKQLKIPFLTLSSNVYLIFPDRSTLKLSQGDISKLQLPITIGFALTEYKIQGATFDSTVIDLKCQSREGIATHKRFCSTYVQLSQLRSFAGLGLLQPSTLQISIISRIPKFITKI